MKKWAFLLWIVPSVVAYVIFEQVWFESYLFAQMQTGALSARDAALLSSLTMIGFVFVPQLVGLVAAHAWEDVQRWRRQKDMQR